MKKLFISYFHTQALSFARLLQFKYVCTLNNTFDDLPRTRISLFSFSFSNDPFNFQKLQVMQHTVKETVDLNSRYRHQNPLNECMINRAIHKKKPCFDKWRRYYVTKNLASTLSCSSITRLAIISEFQFEFFRIVFFFIIPLAIPLWCVSCARLDSLLRNSPVGFIHVQRSIPKQMTYLSVKS